MTENRPAPEWRLASPRGLADPVRMNWPFTLRSSTLATNAVPDVWFELPLVEQDRRLAGEERRRVERDL
jgi:hypothetical protein